MVNFAATSTDNSGLSPIIAYSIAPGSQFSEGETVVTVTADDSSNNRATCQIKVIIDSEKP